MIRRALHRRGARRFCAADDAIAATEYALVVGLVALVLLCVMIAFGDELKSQWQKVANFHSPPACGNSQGSASGMNPNCQ